MATTTAVEIKALVRRWQPLFNLLEKGPIADYRPPGYVQNGREPFFHPRGSLCRKEVLALSLVLPPAGRYQQILLLTTEGGLIVCAYSSERGLYFHLVDKDLDLYVQEPNTLAAELAKELHRLRKAAGRKLESISKDLSCLTD